MFSGTELDFSKRVVDAVVEAFGATKENPLIINLPSTVEHSTPNIFADMIERSEEHTSELQSLMRISYAVFCLKKKKFNKYTTYNPSTNTSHKFRCLIMQKTVITNQHR